MPLFYTESGFLKAADAGDTTTVLKYLSGDRAGKWLSARDRDGDTALHLAALRGHDDLVELLIRSGANINALNRSKQTPLHYAATNDHSAIAQLLASKGAFVNAPDDRGRTPAHRAAECNNVQVLRALAPFKPDLSAQSKNGDTPLHIAIRKSALETAVYMAAIGVDHNIMNSHGETAFSLSLRSESPFVNALFAKIPESAQLPAAGAAIGDDGWFKLDDEKIAHIETIPALSRKITEIFNFRTRERLLIAQNLSTGQETVNNFQKFDDISDTAVADAIAAMKEAGVDVSDTASRKSHLHKNRPSVQ